MSAVRPYRWAIAGVVATLVMDVLGKLTSLTGLTAGLPPILIAKWFRGLFRGQFFTDVLSTDIPPLPLPVGLAIHWSIGATLALTFGLAARRLGRPRPPWWAALAFGCATTVLPALVMFPGMGLGVFGHAAPPEWMAFRTSLVNHCYYGLGLALASRLLIRARPPAATSEPPASAK